MEQLQSYLSDNSITQSVFASSVGTTQATVSRILNGQARPSVELAIKIEKVTVGKVPFAVWFREEARGVA